MTYKMVYILQQPKELLYNNRIAAKRRLKRQKKAKKFAMGKKEENYLKKHKRFRRRIYHAAYSQIDDKHTYGLFAVNGKERNTD